MSDLKASQPNFGDNPLADKLIANSPLRDVDPTSIDELLDRVNEHLIAGAPQKLRENDDDLLRKMVDAFRREAVQWATAEREKKPRATRTAKAREPVDLSQALDI